MEHGHLNAIEYEPKFTGKQQDYICCSIADEITNDAIPEVDDVDMHSLVENLHDEASLWIVPALTNHISGPEIYLQQSINIVNTSLRNINYEI